MRELNLHFLHHRGVLVFLGILFLLGLFRNGICPKSTSRQTGAWRVAAISTEVNTKLPREIDRVVSAR